MNTFQQDELRTDRDVIAIGDFNITSYRSKLYKAVSKHSLSAPASLLAQEFGSNLARNKRYDQILHPRQVDCRQGRALSLRLKLSFSPSVQLFCPAVGAIVNARSGSIPVSDGGHSEQD